MTPSGKSACNYRAIQAAAEMHVGKRLTPEQINAATKALYKSGALKDDTDGSHYVVEDHDAVLNDALRRLGSDETGEAGEYVFDKSAIPANADATIVRGTTPLGNPHSQTGDSKGNPLWDPWYDDKPVPLTGVKYRPIFFYKKEED